MYDSSFTLPTDSSDYTSTMLKGMASFYDNIGDDKFVFIWDQQDRIIYLSKQMEEQLDMNGTVSGTLRWFDILPDSIVTKVQEHFDKSGEQLYLSSFLCEENNHESELFTGFVAPFLIEKQLYFVCQLSDRKMIEEWKDLLADMERFMLSSQMTASLVHEIRNPLTSLKGFLQLIQAGINQKEEYFNVITNEIEKLERITQELLQMSKPAKYEKNQECIRKLIDDVVFLQRTQMDMKNVDFEVSVEDKLFVDCNANQIKQVLLNLIKNGTEAMGKEGLIQIRAEKKDDEIHIHIIDQGTGISAEAVAELVNPYYTTKLDGTGLGLVICNHILTKHHGQLKVETEENKGTMFTIVLPAYQE